MELLERKARKSIRAIIRESISHLFEEDDSFNYALHEHLASLEDEIKREIFYQFINREKLGLERVPLNLIPFDLLKYTWETFMHYGGVEGMRFLKGTQNHFLRNLASIEEIVTENILKLKILTELSGHGHTPTDPSYDFEEAGLVGKSMENGHLVVIKTVSDPQQLKLFDGKYIKYKISVIKNDESKEKIEEKGVSDDSGLKSEISKLYKKYRIDDVISDKGFFDKFKENYISPAPSGYIEDFYDWTVDENGTDIMSDYGLAPLEKLLIQLKEEDNPNKKIVIIDQMLNVAHQRSDLASWFIEGGSRSLSKLSGEIEAVAN